MEITAAMSLEDDPISNDNGGRTDEHEHDMVMPGFRFYPTEEELLEFYLRRKVEGKLFNVELITFIDLYHYDPWELPALAATGEKEWFFYVQRDRKYRNGDRPNRVTRSGYWKATGADRMIRGENNRSIGLKKTLVFYSGKAPKGVRTGWIMNEYRLPHRDTERNQPAEISLCRVYKRSGVEDQHPSLPRFLSTTRTTSSWAAIAQTATASNFDHQKKRTTMMSVSDGDTSSSSDVTTTLGLSKHSNTCGPISPVTNTLLPPSAMQDEQVGNTMPAMMSGFHSKSCSDFFPSTSSFSSNVAGVVDDLHRLVNLQHHQPLQEQNQLYYVPIQNSHPQTQSFPFSAMLFPQQATASQSQHNQLVRLLSSSPTPPTAFSDRMWEWNPIPHDANTGEYNPPFK